MALKAHMICIWHYWGVSTVTSSENKANFYRVIDGEDDAMYTYKI